MKKTLFFISITFLYSGISCNIETDPAQLKIIPPFTTQRLVFIHHSCGSNWLGTGNGNLGDALGDKNYFVRDISYNWDVGDATYIEGDHTDTDDWLTWFDTEDESIMNSVYTTDSQYASYTPITDPGGENDIIMFKSCYPCSEVGSGIDDEKEIYNQFLDYFELHPDKLFILITPPGEEVVSSYQNTRELCQWLVDENSGWLAGYPFDNVGVFDFYCVLSETGSHHTIENGKLVYTYASNYDGTSPYHNSNDHPNSTGNQKATMEFIPLLNYYYNRWQED